MKSLHCHNEFDRDVRTFNDEMLLKWFYDSYSTSKHLLVLRSIVIGMGAKTVGEIGFGRSTMALMVPGVAYHCCDRYNYPSLWPSVFKGQLRYYGTVEKFYSAVNGFDVLFIDYLSSRLLTENDCYKELKRGFKSLKHNGIMAIHDTIGLKYNVKGGVRLLKAKYGTAIEHITLPYCFGLTIVRRISKSKYGSITGVSFKKHETVH